MTYLWLPIGLIAPTIIGWAALRLLEGKHPVLFRAERVVAGLCIGIVGTMFDTFLLHIIGVVPLSFVGMLIVQLLSVVVLGAAYVMQRSQYPSSPVRSGSRLVPWQKIAAGILGLWIAAKLVAGFIFLIGPPYFDDTMNNWNMRGKAFYAQEQLVLEIEPGKGSGVASYPQSVPMIKTWLAHLNGEWHEGLVNSIHLVWYICALALVFFALRRLLSLPWALFGVYVLSSIPLYAMHGMVPYADLYLSIFLFLSVSWLFFAAQETGESRLSFIRIGALVTALLVFTKNEALLLHLPPIGLLLILTIVRAQFSAREKITTVLWYAGFLAMCLIPWLAFKWYFGLSFGNAKSISGLSLEWHEGVLHAIATNTLLEANWGLLPVLFAGLCALQWKEIFRTPLSIVCGFIFMVWLGQFPIYLFTDLYTEALNQTGYARGLIHLVPLCIFATILLLQKLLRTQLTVNR